MLNVLPGKTDRMTGAEDHISAHRRSSLHRSGLQTSSLCGCFFCLEVFSPTEIEEWVDEDDSGVGQTALCPKCGIDSVISVPSDSQEVRNFLSQMHGYWF